MHRVGAFGLNIVSIKTKKCAGNAARRRTHVLELGYWGSAFVVLKSDVIPQRAKKRSVNVRYLMSGLEWRPGLEASYSLNPLRGYSSLVVFPCPLYPKGTDGT